MQARGKILDDLAEMLDAERKTCRTQVQKVQESSSPSGHSADRAAGAASRSTMRPRHQQQTVPSDSTGLQETAPDGFTTEQPSSAQEQVSLVPEADDTPAQSASTDLVVAEDLALATSPASAEQLCPASARPQGFVSTWQENKFYDNASYTPTDDSRYYRKWQRSEMPASNAGWYPEESGNYTTNANVSEEQYDAYEPRPEGKPDYNTSCPLLFIGM